MIIDSKWSFGDTMRDFSQAEIKAEPMLFRCDFMHAMVLGGPITQAFLARTRPMWSVSMVVDTRVHMLMPGWYPCIPGWHHDDVPRTRADGQPNYRDKRIAQHAMVLVGSESCCTEFAIGCASFRVPGRGSMVYGEWHGEIERAIGRGELERHRCHMNRVIEFDARTWHRGVEATGRGWRFFARASYGGSAKPVNEVRRQAQVYMSAVNAGW